jgi:tRNA (cmo5U34)-methyltransferase
MSIQSIKEHFESEAAEFDDIIIKLIPYYGQMLSALVDSIQFNSTDKFSIIDLGCGTGSVAKILANKFPNAKIVCLDIAPKMIEISKCKLEEYQNIEFVVGDFCKFDFEKQFDVVVSSLALHHIESDFKKREFYSLIYKSLTESGQFVNADVVLASDEYNQNINMLKWIEYMNKSVSMDEIQNHWIPTYKSEDRPSKLIDHLKWLEEVGFASVDVLWKYYNFSVFIGIKI